MEPDGIVVSDVNAKVTLTEVLPATRCRSRMPNDASITFESMHPEESKLDLAQPSTIILTLLEPTVLSPIFKPLTVIQKGDDELIAPPEMVNMM